MRISPEQMQLKVARPGTSAALIDIWGRVHTGSTRAP